MKYKNINVDEVLIEFQNCLKVIKDEEKAFDYFADLIEDKLEEDAYIDWVSDDIIQIRFERETNNSTFKYVVDFYKKYIEYNSKITNFCDVKFIIELEDFLINENGNLYNCVEFTFNELINNKLTNITNKLKIAKELLKNTKNIHLKFFIEEYISNLNEIKNINKVLEELDLFEYIDFDRCIEYINNSKFDITGWCLWEIPLSNIYTFYNESRKEAFDLIVDCKDNVIPEYIDENCNVTEANSIQEAIEKYITEGEY